MNVCVNKEIDLFCYDLKKGGKVFDEVIHMSNMRLYIY